MDIRKTIRLYDEDAYKTEFEAEVLACEEVDKKDGKVYQVWLPCLVRSALPVTISPARFRLISFSYGFRITITHASFLIVIIGSSSQIAIFNTYVSYYFPIISATSTN